MFNSMRHCFYIDRLLWAVRSATPATSWATC